MPGKGDVRAGRAFVELFVKGAQFERGLNAFSAKFKKFGETITAVGRQLSAFGLVAGTGLGLAAKRFADFDDQMRTVGAVTTATDGQLRLLTDTAKRLATTMGFSAVAVGSLMTELGRAGFDSSQVDKMTGAVLDLSRATGTDATLSSKIVAAAIRQFGLGAEDAARVADVLTVAANKSFTSVESLGEALSYAGPVAKDFGVSLEDTLALFGGLGDMGIQGSNAGTAVRRLMTLTGAEAKKMEEIFGVTFTDAAGNIRPLIDTLEEVRAATKNLGSADRAAKFFEAFGLLGITAASSIGQSAGSIRDLKDALDNAGGAASETAKKMNEGLGGSFRVLLAAGEALTLKIGEALAPALQKLAAMAIEVAGKVGAWINENRELVVVMAAAVIGVGAFGFSLVALGSALTLVSYAIGTLASIVGGLISALTFLTNSVGLAVVGIAALAAGIVYASGIVPQLVSALSPLLGAIKALGAALGSGDFAKAWDIAATSAKLFGSVVLDVFGQLPEFAGYAAGRMLRLFVDAFSSLAEMGKDFIANLFTGDFDASGFLSKWAKLHVDAFNAFSSGLGGGEAPTLAMSDRTKGLTDAMKKMAEPSQSDGTSAEDAKKKLSDQLGGKSAADVARDKLNKNLAPAPNSSGLGTGEGKETIGMFSPEKKDKPNIDSSAIEEYQSKMRELSDALYEGTISQKEYDAGVQQAKTGILKISDPVATYRETITALNQALRDGTITASEFVKAADEAKRPFSDASPIEKYQTRVKELRELLKAGLIDSKTFGTEQMKALPDNVQKIIEQAKTPLEKFNEKITEARDALNAKLITPKQFAFEQQRLQKEFREGSEGKGGRVSVGFSAAGLIAQGAGGGKDAIPGKLDQQLNESKRQSGQLKKIADALAKRKPLVFL